MAKWPTYVMVFLFCFIWVNDGFTQIDKILKPVEIHPPHPGTPPAPPQKRESDEQLAAHYFQNKEYDKAVVLYEKLYENSQRSLYYTYLLYCLVELDNFKDAEKVVKNQVKKSPDNLKYLVDLGFVYTESGDLTKAKKQFEQAIKSLSPDKRQIMELANGFLYRGQTDYAVETYKRGKQLMDDYPFNLELGNLYEQIRNYSMMVEEYLDYVDYNPVNMPVIQQRMQDVLDDDPDKTVSELFRRSLLVRVQKAPAKIYYSELLLWYNIQEKDFEQALLQAKSIDRRNDEEGERVYDLARLSLSNENFDVAIDGFAYILKKGRSNYLYIDSKIGILQSRYLKVTTSSDYDEDDLLELEKEYNSMLDEYGRNSATLPVMRYLGNLQAFYLDKTSEAVNLLYEAISIPNAPANMVAECKIELADILVFTGDVWEAKLLYAQVEKAFKNDPIGHLAKFKNARLSFYIGEFEWAKAQLDVLKAATSKLIANDALRFSVLISDNIDMDSSTVALEMYGRADLLLFRNHPEEALMTLDSIFNLATHHPIFDEVLYKKAEINYKQGRNEDAVELLLKIVEDYSYDITADNALYMLALITENEFKDDELAMEYYQKLLTDYPSSLFTVDARKHFRKLRGDFSSEEERGEDYFFYDLQPFDN
ncbi:MAG: tetratricopeptide repeat protein [Bacteroidales bacterium]